MNKSLSIIAAILVLCVLTASPITASARHVVHVEVSIMPGTTYQDPLDMQKGEVLSCFWTTDHPVKFYLTDPDGETIRQWNGTVGQAILDITESGTYTFNWENEEDSAVMLVFEKEFLHPEEPSRVWIIALAILIALIALMLAAIVYLATRNLTKK